LLLLSNALLLLQALPQLGMRFGLALFCAFGSADASQTLALAPGFSLRNAAFAIVVIG
jgi:hypothetical protein